MSGFIVGGGKSDFRKNWRRYNRLFPFKPDGADVKKNTQRYSTSETFN